LAKAVGVREDRLAYPPASAWNLGYMGREFMSAIYNAFDVLLNPSMGEGFGVPIVEAQACGVPVIVSDHSAMSELVGPGWLVEGDPWWDALQESFFFMPHIEAVRERLDGAYGAAGDTRLRDEAWEFAQDYDANRVATEYWVPTLDGLLGPREVGPLNRAQRRAMAKAGA
jgi:glycosyltransferase involved in cell wall biosynthesis